MTSAAASSPYHVEYDGYYAMLGYDKEENALKRWFENYKLEKYAYFAADTECLIITQKQGRKRKYQVCEIEDVGQQKKREVAIDHMAPPAPVTTFAAKRLYVPPPPKTAAELRKEEEWAMMMARGYEPVRRPKMRMATASWDYRHMLDGPIAPMEVEYEIEWVRFKRWDRPIYSEPYKPVIPTHRRNV